MIRKKIRCKKCGRVFFFDLGSKELNIEIKCPKCGYEQKIELFENRIKNPAPPGRRDGLQAPAQIRRLAAS